MFAGNFGKVYVAVLVRNREPECRVAVKTLQSEYRGRPVVCVCVCVCVCVVLCCVEKRLTATTSCG